ncbi:CoA-binding protein [Martelella alba]|uniref:CoA-binding protein n=1 Tax=Martelella alba TaxID=2590451 RepID=A0A506UI92_9HYPH|nr:CoA-binding protein [Martelella alba]TPW33003.1 CoA-binding protein [Martelella alba]
MNEIGEDQIIRHVLESAETIALVGASPKPERPSYGVMGFLLSHGYDVIPVNPGLAGKTIHGQMVYASLADIGRPLDMIDVFRASDFVGGVVDEALALNPLPKVIWMQLGIVNEVAAAKARTLGLTVIMDRCPAIEIPRLLGH